MTVVTERHDDTLKYAAPDCSYGGNGMNAPNPPPGDEDGKSWKWTDFYRFVLALTIILGFFGFLVLALVRNFEDIPTLTGVFSGWIVAIIGFYFMEQASDRAATQQSTILLNDVKRSTNEAVETAADETDSLKAATKKMVKEYENKIRDLKNVIKAYDEECGPPTESTPGKG